MLFVKVWPFYFCLILLFVGSCVKYKVQGVVPQFIAVNDGGASRILFFQAPITSNGQQASFVLGQPDFVSNTANNGGAGVGLNGPRGLNYDGQHLLVADYTNNRILIWNSLPTQNQQPADLVLGQPSSTAVGPNWNGVTLQSMRGPSDVLSTGTQIFVADALNSRILVWNTFPTTPDQAANVSLSPSLGVHLGIAYGNGRLFVVDSDNHRILAWNAIPTQNNQAPSFALGQPNTSTTILNNSPQGAGIVSAYSLSGLFAACSNGSNFVVGDRGNNRALVWKTLPSYSWQPADLVLGQPDFVSNTANNTPGSPGVVSSQALSGANGPFCDSQSLSVYDYNNQRVLVWKNYPSVNQQPADFVIGQPDMATVVTGVTSQSTFVNGGPVISNSIFSGVVHSGGY